LRGKTLRVALPEISFPYMYLPDFKISESEYGYGDPETTSLEHGSDYSGIVIQYLEKLAVNNGFFVNYTYVSRGNINRDLDGANNK
jgi:hypothetical protein